MLFFVAGIDTGIGKTIATGLLAAWFQRQGYRTTTQKLVQTGCDGTSEDIRIHRQLMGMELLPEDFQRTTCPVIYPFPASPHLAADLAGGSVDIEQIVHCTHQLAERHDVVLIEGAGGLFVPLTRETTIIDLLARQAWPVILVATPRLGSINHTLLSLDAMHRRSIHVAAVIYNLHFRTAPEIVADTRQIIRVALAKMGSSAPVIDLPGGVDLTAPQPWNDEGLQWLLRTTPAIGVGGLGFPRPPPSEPYVRFSRIRLASQWGPQWD